MRTVIPDPVSVGAAEDTPGIVAMLSAMACGSIDPSDANAAATAVSTNAPLSSAIRETLRMVCPGPSCDWGFVGLFLEQEASRKQTHARGMHDFFMNVFSRPVLMKSHLKQGRNWIFRLCSPLLQEAG
jgi:hypothetical protein